MRIHPKRYSSMTLALAMALSTALLLQPVEGQKRRSRPEGPRKGTEEREPQAMLAPESMDFLHELAERTGRMSVVDELNEETVQFVGIVRLGRSHEPREGGLVLDEGRSLAVFRVPVETERRPRRPAKRHGEGPNIVPILSGEEAEEGGIHMVRIHNPEIGEPSVYVIRPLSTSKEDMSEFAQKTESADQDFTEQDLEDLQAIQDMYDNDAMDQMYMDQADNTGGGGSETGDGGGGGDDGDDGGSTDDGNGGDTSGGDSGGGGDGGDGGGGGE